MARDFFETTIALPDATAANVLKPLSSVKVSVVPRGATDLVNTLVDIFQADTGLTKGPDPKSGASGTNPFTTGGSGSVRFWAEGPFEYDIVYEDTITPARVADRVGWNCIPAKSGSIPSAYLAVDGGVQQGHLSAAVISNEVPIGGVIEWWRPNVSVPIPAGYVVCDGSSVATHDFPGVAGAITVPDLRNLFILGADSTKADGTGASGDDVVTGGPGIRGSGGSNRNTLDVTQMPVHTHVVSDPTHAHSVYDPTHAHSVADPGHAHGLGGNVPLYGNGWGAINVTQGGGFYVPNNNNYRGGSQTGTAGAGTGIGIYGAATGVSIYGAGTGVTNQNAGSGSPHNNMPRWIGLLRIMKVKR